MLTSVIPVICGDTDIPSRQQVLFTELEPVTAEDLLVRPKPDFSDGARLQDVDKTVRDQRDSQSLYSLTLPTKHPSVPVAPNFFSRPKALMRQRRQPWHSDRPFSTEHLGLAPCTACRTTAPTSRSTTGMPTRLVLPTNPDCFSYTPTTPLHTTPGGRPEYHMTQIDTWGITGMSTRSGAGPPSGMRRPLL